MKLFGDEIIKAQKTKPDNSERFGLISEAFKEITDDQKKKIAEFKKKDEKRFKDQMKEYEEKGYYMMENGKRSNQAADSKNPAYPRKVANEFMMFSKLFGNDLVEKSGKKVDLAGRAGIIKAAFDKMASDHRKKLDKAIVEDKKRFEKQLKEFEEKGFYINEDGE